MRHFCTYFALNYSVKGIALYRSLCRHAGPFRLWVLCLDEDCFNLLKKLNLPYLTPISISQFEDSDPELLVAKSNRSKIEYYFTLTPSLMLYVVKKNVCVEVLTYLDSDLYFYSDLCAIDREFCGKSLLIIEHRFSSHQKYLEAHGRYNVGYISVRQDNEGLEALDWWRERCLEWCYDRVEPGRFADQKYLDRWPEMYGNVLVLQHNGANLAPWNLQNYVLSMDSGKMLVGGNPLIFYHFQGLKKINPNTYDTNLRDWGSNDFQLIVDLIYLPYIQELEGISKELGLSENIQVITTRHPGIFKKIIGLVNRVYVFKYLTKHPAAIWYLVKVSVRPASRAHIQIPNPGQYTGPL